MALRIREQQRRGRPKEAFGEYVTWTEWQVMAGRHVLSRWGFREQAERELQRLQALNTQSNQGRR